MRGKSREDIIRSEDMCDMIKMEMRAYSTSQQWCIVHSKIGCYLFSKMLLWSETVTDEEWRNRLSPCPSPFPFPCIHPYLCLCPSIVPLRA